MFGMWIRAMSIIFLEKPGSACGWSGARARSPRLWASGPQEDEALGYRRKGGAKELTEILKQLTKKKKVV